jgi:hypothetical protein
MQSLALILLDANISPGKPTQGIDAPASPPVSMFQDALELGSTAAKVTPVASLFGFVMLE